MGSTWNARAIRKCFKDGKERRIKVSFVKKRECKKWFCAQMKTCTCTHVYTYTNTSIFFCYERFTVYHLSIYPSSILYLVFILSIIIHYYRYIFLSPFRAICSSTYLLIQSDLRTFKIWAQFEVKLSKGHNKSLDVGDVLLSFCQFNTKWNHLGRGNLGWKMCSIRLPYGPFSWLMTDV